MTELSPNTKALNYYRKNKRRKQETLNKVVITRLYTERYCMSFYGHECISYIRLTK